MKTILIAIAALSLTVASYGQYTMTRINQAPKGEEIFSYTRLKKNDVVDIGSTGPNQNWDFTIVDNTRWGGTYYLHKATPIQKAMLPEAEFSISRHEYYIPGAEYSEMSYLVLGSSEQGMQVFGYETGLADFTKFNDPIKIYSFPATLGTSFQDTAFLDTYKMRLYEFYEDYTLDSASQKMSFTKDVVFDAAGTLKLTSGTYTNCLRSKTILIDRSEYRVCLRRTNESKCTWYNSSEVGRPHSIDTTVIYQWYRAGYYFPMVQLEYDAGTDTLKNSLIGVDMTFSTDGIGKQFAKTSSSIYPNPANSIIFFKEAPIGAEISITDQTGKIISVNSSPVEPGINVDYLPTGVYIISIVSKDSVRQEKLIISR